MKILIAALLLVGFSAPTLASEFGCKVVLCASSPKASNHECKITMQKLSHELSRGHPFPSCEEAGDSSSGKGSFVRQVFDYFDPCPDGLKPAAQGSYVSVLSKNSSNQQTKDVFNPLYKGWTSTSARQSEEISSNDHYSKTPTPRACVGNKLSSSKNWQIGYLVDYYDKVVWQNPQPPKALDVYIDGKFYMRNHQW